MIQKKTGLGRGLDALISMDDTPLNDAGSSSINEVDIDQIYPNPDQPRHDFDEDAINDLATSIKNIGIIQPITLRQQSNGSYMIIAGERRYKAARKAGLMTIPAYVRTVDDDTIMEMALIENIQREDLNTIEVSLAYQKLIDQYGMTQEELAQRIGKNRSTVTNFLRLLKLPAEIQLALKNKTLSMGHARAMLPIEDPEQQVYLYKQIVAGDFSVRKVESLVRDFLEGKITDFNHSVPTASKPKNDNEELFSMLSEHLTKVFNTKVKMACNDKGQGKITISFKNDQELERIIATLDDINSKQDQNTSGE